MNDKAHEIILMAHGQILELLMGVVLAKLDEKESRAIKAAWQRNAEGHVLGYSGGPIDLALLQARGQLLQQWIDRMISNFEAVEQAVRLQAGQPEWL